jgi:hemolysin D
MNPLPVQYARQRSPVEPRRVLPGEYEFLPAAIEILESPQSPLRSMILMTICGFAAAALAWSFVGRIDIIASAQGKIQPVGRTKTIQPLQTGKVVKVDVANGQTVKSGDTLVELDSGEAEADEATLRANLVSLKAEVLRRTIALEAATKRAATASMPIAAPDIPPQVAAREQRVLNDELAQLGSSVATLQAQLSEKLAERSRLKGTMSAQQQLLAILKQRVDMRMELLSRSVGSKASVIDAEEAYQTQETNLIAQQGQLGQTEAGLQVTNREIDKTYSAFLADNAQRLAEAERQLASETEKLGKARLRTSHMVLKSPIDGVVQGLMITTLGQVVSTGEQIMQVVPDRSTLEIECYLPNADIGFVKPGQPAAVKVDSFPFTAYGTLDAHVTRVAQDAIPEADADQRERNPAQPAKTAFFGGAQRTQDLVFPISLALDQPSVQVEGATAPLVPGMTVTVEIKTGTRRIVSYLFSPLIDVASTAMRER